MIIFITTAQHGYTVKSLVSGAFGCSTPPFKQISYEQLFTYREMLDGADLRRATYIFTDIERLSNIQLLWAAQIYQVFTKRNLRCLNDPARVMDRVGLLRRLHAAGINPFQVWRADELPKPQKFPVFVRGENDHLEPLTDLILDQEQLDRTLEYLRAHATPLRGLIVLEHFPAPYDDKLWHKWGTYRIGNTYSVDHIAVDDNWLVKYGDYEKINELIVNDEYDAILSNRYASDVAYAFNLGSIEYGRADHAVVNGRTVIYEINTNPFFGQYVRDGKPLRAESQIAARKRLAAAFLEIDTF